MKTSQERLHSYRQTLRQLLAEAETTPDIEVTDEWILKRVARLTPDPKTGNSLDALKEHFTAAKDYGYTWLGFHDVLRAIEYAREGKLKGLKVGL